MDVVYEAVDQKLGRHVAVKLLGETIGEDNTALERFWVEARAASALNHPGICTIHYLDESAESPFIVMELLEGNSLEKAYHGCVMPYTRLLETGTQLADALDAAHRKGILHRDIKPANIFLTNSGQAKLLDFGVAKLDASLDGYTASHVPERPAFVKPITRDGLSVRTVVYCLRNRPQARRWTRAVICSPLGSCSMRWQPASTPFRERPPQSSSTAS